MQAWRLLSLTLHHVLCGIIFVVLRSVVGLSIFATCRCSWVKDTGAGSCWFFYLYIQRERLQQFENLRLCKEETLGKVFASIVEIFSSYINTYVAVLSEWWQILFRRIPQQAYDALTAGINRHNCVMMLLRQAKQQMGRGFWCSKKIKRWTVMEIPTSQSSYGIEGVD